jgi:hypothetical protein
MATEAEDALADLYEGRSEAGEAGFRPFSFTILDATWTGQHTGEGSEIGEANPITEANGQPPRVRFLTGEEIALGNLGAGAIEVGPITPPFAGGGTSLETLAGDLQTGATRHGLLRGPGHVGTLYRLIDINSERATRYMLRAAPDANYPQ